MVATLTAVVSRQPITVIDAKSPTEGAATTVIAKRLVEREGRKVHWRTLQQSMLLC